jgi:alkaline phosphatase
MNRAIVTAALAVFFASPLVAAPKVDIRLPERFRVITGQKFDVRVEAADLSSLGATLALTINGFPVPGTPEISTDNDNNAPSLDKAWTFRNVSLNSAGVWVVKATLVDGLNNGEDTTRVGVQDFQLKGEKRNIILYIGDAMGTAYRDAGRIVGKSVDGAFREGFFDELQEMDTMPVSGMVMTYAMDRVVPDSANAATAWAAGSKTVEGALNAFPDNNDWRFTGSQATKQFALDNPRVETLWEYLKRVYKYKTGIVTTSDVTDATPAGQGGHSISRGLLKDISRQYVDGVFTSGPAFDVILGGGKEQFDARTIANSGDTRNLATELQGMGFTYVQNRTDLLALPSGNSAPSKLLGLFRTSHMNVAYDKLGLPRPVDEPAPSFSGFTNQPFLEEMTQKAIEVLSKGDSPFVLMVEGASIDKQSHSNHAAGQIWDTIEFDKAIGVGREFAQEDSYKHFNNGNHFGRKTGGDTLVLVTADHDQSLAIIGVGDANLGGRFNTRSNQTYPPAITGEVDGFPDYVDANEDGYPENSNRLRIVVGYRTGNHTGSSVPITAEGVGALLFTGYFDQTDIFFKMAKALSMDQQDAKELRKALHHINSVDALEPNY